MFYKKLIIFLFINLIIAPAFAADAYMNSIDKTALHSVTTDPVPLTIIEGAHVRMVTFTNYTGYKTTDTQMGADVWTTADPELKNQCMQFVKNHPHATHQQLTLWIAELLGVAPYQADTRQFVVFDIPVIQAYYGNPESAIGIFRPCTDPRIGPHADGSSICPSQMNSSDNNIGSDYKTWFINNSIAAYTRSKTNNQDNGAPWTELGFTYNWNPEAAMPFGLSEFVVKKNTPVTVLANPLNSNTAYISPEEYCGT